MKKINKYKNFYLLDLILPLNKNFEHLLVALFLFPILYITPKFLINYLPNMKEEKAELLGWCFMFAIFFKEIL